MSEDKPQALAGAVQYIQQYKEQYSIDELRKKLKASGYPENVISEAENQIFGAANRDDVNVSSAKAVTENLSTGRKIGEYVFGFVGFYVLIIVGLGIIGLGVSIFFYFYFRKRRKYVARGILTAIILSIVLVIAVILYLFIILGWF